MATLSTPTLTVTKHVNTKTVDLVVKAKLTFTPIEVCFMNLTREHCAEQDITWFTAKCEIWSQDGAFNGDDDKLYTFSNFIEIPTGAVTSEVELTWEKNGLNSSIFNEDDSFLQGYEDEIYAKVRVTGFSLSTSNFDKSKTSAVLHDHF